MIHYFDGEGALCREPSVRNWTLDRTFVTCPDCAITLVHEGQERFPSGVSRPSSKAVAPLRLR